MLTIKNRTDIEVPQEYRREFQVPFDAEGQELVKKIEERCGRNWRYLELTGLDFSGALLPEPDFRSALLNRVFFANATLTEPDFRNATLNGGVFFNYATLNGGDFYEATVNGGFFDHATLNRVTFNRATMTGGGFSEATVTSGDFRNATLNETCFYRAKMHRVANINFSGTKHAGSATHPRVRVIPEIFWEEVPIAAILPEGDQPLLLAIGYETHTPDEWLAFSEAELEEMSYEAPEWHTKHMAEAVRRAKELENAAFGRYA
jgi:uncharacterized protein YjbI with pentapeptide repeats